MIMVRYKGTLHAAAIFFACLMLIPKHSALAQTDMMQMMRQRLLTTSGTAEVRVPPDQLEVRLGVEIDAATASAARQQNAARAARVISALKSLGIPESSITTSVFTIDPVRRFDTSGQQGVPPIVGYDVTNIITVRTSQLDLAPSIIDEGVRAGANRVDAVVFGLKDDAAARQTALRQAVANAQNNARTLAASLGLTLVQVQNVQAGGTGVVPPPVTFRAEALSAGASTPIMPGTVTVNATATVTYLIK
jgi:uncharacterized protein YggE